MRFLFLGIAFSGFVSCKCKDTVCPALDSKYDAWLNVTNGDSIKFKNSNGATIIFKVANKGTTESKIVDCKGSGLDCNCSVCEYPTGSYYELTRDSSRIQIDSLGRIYRVHDYSTIQVKSEYDRGNKTEASSISTSPYILNYTILDHENSFQISPSLVLKPGDSLLSNYNIGGKNYSNVIVHQTDTSVAPYPYSYQPQVYYPHFKYKFYITKSYFAKDYGVIAFYDNLTQSLFYRVY